MRLVVVSPPAPIVSPDQIRGSHGSNDEAVAALIAAATEEIDGPTGWLGRCFGVQTLELRSSCWPDLTALPCPPFLEFVSITYTDPDGALQIWPGDTDFPVTNPPRVRGRVGDVVIRYRAGYDGSKNGPVPERARQAVILAVQHMLSLGAENLFLKQETVEGVGSTQYVVSDIASKVIREASDRLLQGLRVYV